MIQTKKNEVVKTIYEYNDIASANGMYINKVACKEWVEDFIDEDTSEVVTIERKEVLYDRGTAITSDLIPKLLFYFQSGELKEIEVSNQRRAAYETSYGTRVYLAVAEIGAKRKKYKFLFSAHNIPVSIDILKDYIELNFTGGYRITSIKEFKTSIILEDSLKEESEIVSDEEVMNDDKFYQITAIIQNEDGYEFDADAVVKTVDLDKAILLLNRKLMEGRKEEDKFTSKLEEAKLINVDYIIEDEFVAAYAHE